MFKALIFLSLLGLALSQCVDVSRSAWGAKPPKGTTGIKSRSNVIIHHSATDGCDSQSSCSSRVRSFQNHHMNTNGWADIGYNFLVGEDGKVYEGRGWYNMGAHAYGHNSNSIGICVIGDYTSRPPNSDAQNAVRRLIACGVSRGLLPSSYTLCGHRDVGSTSCPGNSFYQVIRGWPHYGRCS